MASALSTLTLEPSVATAASDEPAAETTDQSKNIATSRKVAERWDAVASTTTIDAFGAFSDSIPIEVPSFRKITPKLSLTYRSSAGNRWVGVGWSLDGVGTIERAGARKGAPRYDSSDIYLVDGEELVRCTTGSTSPSCTTGGTHSTKTEDYSRIALSGTGTSSRWTVTAKDGTKSVYAPVFVLRGADGTSGTADDQVFKWGLQQVIDANGNVVTYNWGADQFGGSWDYLDSITYNGTTIKLYYEQRPDVESSATGAGTLEAVYGRIKTVEIKVSGVRLRAYKLSYTPSGATGRSLLSSVTQYGKDATLDGAGTVTGGTSLPAITAGYASSSVTPSFVSGNTDTYMDNDSRFITLDINGDGKDDILEVYNQCTLVLICTAKAASWISTGSGFTRSAEIVLPSFPDQTIVADVNGDGKDDFIFLDKGTSSWTRRVFLSNGVGFSAGATDTSMPNKNIGPSTFAALDIDGDGETDMVELYPTGSCPGYLNDQQYADCIERERKKYARRVWLSNGAGFVAGSTVEGLSYNELPRLYPMDFNGDGRSDLLVVPSAGANMVWISGGNSFSSTVSTSGLSNSSYTKSFAIDINGDGKTDLLQVVPEIAGDRWKTWLSTGSSFTLTSSMLLSGVGGLLGVLPTLVAGDVNGDGRSDLIMLKSAGTSVQRTIFLSTGSGFVAGTVDSLAGQAEHEYRAADVNGDGRTDLVELYVPLFSSSRTRRIWLVGGGFPDLLGSLGTGLGATRTVSYTPSSAWTNTNIPSIVQTATSIKVADGRGGSSTTTYSYSGGRYDVLQQRFLGFAYQKEVRPCITGESSCPYTESWFRQDNGAVSKPSRIDQRDGSGKLLRSEVYEYKTNGTTAPWTALETGRWEYTYVNSGATCPGADCKREYTSRAYNAYGEITQEVDYGDYDVSGDEDTTTTAFVPNPTAYIVNRPADVKTFQGVGTTGTLLNETLAYYDGATAWNVAPAVGLRTKWARWLSSPNSFVTTQAEYDEWGNVTATVNPLGARTSITFDATYHLFPTSVRNALGQATSTTWGGTCGVPTSATDRNGQVTTFTYDPLCRLTEKSAPGGKFEKHTWVSLGDAANQYEQLDRPAADGTSQTWWSRRYFDGLNRTWREVKKGPNAATGNIYVDRTFDARGGDASETEPYYWASGTATTYTTTFGYDALDRRSRVTFPDGAQQTTSYGLWSSSTTDELGHSKTDRYDAHGNRVAHDEIVGGAKKTTTYAYDARNALRQSTDPAGNTVDYTTDSLGRTTSMVDPSSGTWTYEYDGADRLTAHVDPKQQRTTFGYDAIHRKTTKTSRAGTAQAATVSWAYDESRSGYFNIGLLTTLEDNAGSKEIDYDVAGRIVRSVRTINGTGYEFRYGFDADDRVLWTTYPDEDTLGTPASPLRYDGAGRLTSIPGYVTSVVYDADGRPTRINNANSTVTTRSYSPARGWPTSTTTVAGTTTIQNLTFTRNAKGLLSRVQSPIGNESWTYAYDELDRVVSATNVTSSTHSQSFTYDAIGNLTSNSLLGAYTYGARPHAVTTAGENTYAYDSAGLMTSGAGRILTWNGDGLLASTTVGGVTSTYTYDADGERVQQQDGTLTRRYLGDDYESDSAGTVTKYVSLGDLLVARKDGATKTWLHTDHLGSIQAATASSGAEVHRRKYRPYGGILSDSESLEFESRGYTGQRHDASGLVYLHARYYDPALGRFISPDPIIDGTDTVGLNRHAYVGNNPINATDPSGLAAVAPHVRYTERNAGRAQEKSKPPPPPPPPPPPAPAPRSPSYPWDSEDRSPVSNGVPISSPAAVKDRVPRTTRERVQVNVVRPSLGAPKKSVTTRSMAAKLGEGKRVSRASYTRGHGSETPRVVPLKNQALDVKMSPFPESPYMDCLRELDEIDVAVDPILPPDGADASGGAIERICFEMHIGR